MRLRRGLLLGILLYVVLDLSVAALPGAFVFDPDASVEGTQSKRHRSAAEVVIVPPPAPASHGLAPPRIPLRDPRSAIAAASPTQRVVRRLPRGATFDPAPPSDDAH